MKFIFTSALTIFVVCAGCYAYDIISKGNMIAITTVCIIAGIMSLRRILKKGE